MSLPPIFLPELKKLFPQLTHQLDCLNGDYVSHQSAASIVRCMRNILSDPCHLLPESLLSTTSTPLQLKKDALDDLKELVSESAFMCAPRFPGRTPSLITVADKKSMIFEPDLYPGYVIPTIGFCFEVPRVSDSDWVMDSGCTKAGLIDYRGKNRHQQNVSVKWGNEAKPSEENLGNLQKLSKIRVLITPLKKDDPDEPLSKFCEVKCAFSVNEQDPAVIFAFSDFNESAKDFVIKRDDATLNLFKNVSNVVYEQNAKITLLDQCHEYTILKGVARRLAESFNQLSRVSGELKILTDLKAQIDAIEKKDVAQGQSAKPDDEKAKQERELKAKWADQKGNYDRLKDGNIHGGIDLMLSFFPLLTPSCSIR